MASALTITPPSRSAKRNASADLPLAVGPAISTTCRVSVRGFMAQACHVHARLLNLSAAPSRPRPSDTRRPCLTLIQPFRALRPAPGRAAEVLAPPYDVLSSAEARQRAEGKPWSFLHISKPEIDLDPAIDPHHPAVYAKAAEHLGRMIAAGVLIRDAKPCYYAYRLTWRDRRQTGLAVIASIADYDTNRIRKHELTTPVKEDDRVHQIEAVNAQTGPVMIAYPAAPEIDAALTEAASGAPTVDMTADDGVRHELWVISDDAKIAALARAVDALRTLYIADGHHRS